jgi:hypothetical protein
VTFWSLRRSVVFLTIWALVTPFKVILIDFHRQFSIIIYAGTWMYVTGRAPDSNSPLLISVGYAFSVLPFYATGLIMAGLMWHGSRDEHFTRQQYYGLVVTLLAIQTLLAIIIPCPISSGGIVYCFPTTALPALFLISRVVKQPTVPWSGAVTNNQSLASDSAERPA